MPSWRPHQLTCPSCSNWGSVFRRSWKPWSFLTRRSWNTPGRRPSGRNRASGLVLYKQNVYAAMMNINKAISASPTAPTTASGTQPTPPAASASPRSSRASSQIWCSACLMATSLCRQPSETPTSPLSTPMTNSLMWTSLNIWSHYWKWEHTKQSLVWNKVRRTIIYHEAIVILSKRLGTRSNLGTTKKLLHTHEEQCLPIATFRERSNLGGPRSAKNLSSGQVGLKLKTL